MIRSLLPTIVVAGAFVLAALLVPLADAYGQDVGEVPMPDLDLEDPPQDGGDDPQDGPDGQQDGLGGQQEEGNPVAPVPGSLYGRAPEPPARSREPGVASPPPRPTGLQRTPAPMPGNDTLAYLLPFLINEVDGALQTGFSGKTGYRVRFAGLAAMSPLFDGFFWYEWERLGHDNDGGGRLYREAWMLDTGVTLALGIVEMVGIATGGDPWLVRPGLRIGAARWDLDGRITHGLRLLGTAEGWIYAFGIPIRDGPSAYPRLSWYAEVGYTVDSEHPVLEALGEVRFHYAMGKTVHAGVRYLSLDGFHELAFTLGLRINLGLFLMNF